MLSKLFHRSARPNRTTGRRGPSLALEALENRTVMTTGLTSISAASVHVTASFDMPAVTAEPTLSYHGPVGLSVSASLDAPVVTTDLSAARLGPVTAMPELPRADPINVNFGPIAAETYEPIYVN